MMREVSEKQWWLPKEEDEDFNQNEWYIENVEHDLYNTIGKDFPLSFHFTFYDEDEYNNLPLNQKNL